MAPAVDLSPYEKLPAIDVIRQVVRRWWGVELAFADPRGYVLAHGRGEIVPPENDFCRASLSSPEGFRRCNESIKVVADRLRAGPERPFVHECHLGFSVVAAPIRIEGRLCGFLFTGGAAEQGFGDPQRAAAAARLREIDPEAARKLAGTARVPALSAAELARLRDLLALGAHAVEQVHAQVARGNGARAPAGVLLRGVVGRAAAMQGVFHLLEKVVRSDSTVLIQGESGTGKELVAHAVHDSGARARGPFVVQNCSAFNDNLLESALFGHVRGAFTGAVEQRKGLFEVADGGTFFLDEVGDMSPALQVKLLRVLQEGTLTPVGSAESRRVDVRVIAATHRDLQSMVDQGEFREDLFYRINVIKLELPPLRERLEDLPEMVDHFLRRHHRGPGRPPRPSAEAMAVLSRYRWPGNIRELENEIERMLVLGGDLPELSADLLSPRVRQADAAAGARGRTAFDGGTLRSALQALEREMIQQGLIRTHGNRSRLARELGVSRSNLLAKIAHYGLDQHLRP